MLACGDYTTGNASSSGVLLAAGWFGLIAAVIGYFLAIAELFTKKEGFIDIPTGSLAPVDKDQNGPKQ